MCLVLLAIDKHPDYSLVVAANRDEFHARPTSPAASWRDAPEVLAGRDLSAMGTWLGVTRAGRFAAVTNLRVPGTPARPLSRGDLVRTYLEGHLDARAHARDVIARAHLVGPFNLVVGGVVGSTPELWVTDGSTLTEVRAAVRGVSNASETSRASGATPWPKVARGEAALLAALEQRGELSTDALFEILRDRTTAPDELLPDTGVGLAGERFLSSAFLVSPAYGTRCSTVVTFDRRGRVTFEERSFGPGGEGIGVVREAFTIQSPPAGS